MDHVTAPLDARPARADGAQADTRTENLCLGELRH
jgi:hypothetical protein